MSDAPGPSKRRRTKNAVACQQCQVRKSRCEMIEREGCYRCRVLKSDCSFRLSSGSPGEEADLGSVQAFARSNISGSSLARLEDRTERIELLLNRLVDRPGDSKQHVPLAPISIVEPAHTSVEHVSIGAAPHVAYAFNVPYRSTSVAPQCSERALKESLER
jgi:hypothetical protein